MKFLFNDSANLTKEIDGGFVNYLPKQIVTKGVKKEKQIWSTILG